MNVRDVRSDEQSVTIPDARWAKCVLMHDMTHHHQLNPYRCYSKLSARSFCSKHGQLLTIVHISQQFIEVRIVLSKASTINIMHSIDGRNVLTSLSSVPYFTTDE